MEHKSYKVGQKLKDFRISKGFTQQQLELEIEASSGHICRIEKGEVNPTKETLIKIAEILQLDIQQKLELFPIINTKRLPKIGLIIQGGGNFSFDPKTILNDNEKVIEVNKWMLQIPEIQIIAQLEPIPPYTFLPSSMITSAQYEILAKQIHDHYNQYDGFIVTHGIDEMTYSASALSFMLQKLNKPIIFTGYHRQVNSNTKSNLLSEYNKKKTLSNLAKINIINSVYAAASDVTEVGILYGRKLLRANRSVLTHYYNDSIYESVHTLPLATAEFGLDIASHCRRRNNNTLQYYPKLEKKIIYLKLYSDFDPSVIEYCIKEKYRGIVLEVIGIGSFPPSVIPNIKKAVNSNITVVATSNHQAHCVNLDHFYVGWIGRDAGVIATKDMTAEAAYTKLMWVLAQTDNPQKIKKMMLTNYVGEITE